MDADARNASKEPLSALKKALQAPGTESCAECRSRLPDFVDAQLDGRPYAALFPEIAAHLDACLECAGAYARIYNAEWAARSEQLPQPAAVPQPDLSFLNPESGPAASAAPGDSTSLPERLRSAVERLGSRLTLRLNPELFLLLQPAPSAASLRAGRPGEAQLLMELEPRPELPLRLAAYRDPENPQAAAVEITWTPPGREWPDLAGAVMLLEYAGLVRRETSDAWGTAVFEDVPVSELAQLAVQIEMEA